MSSTRGPRFSAPSDNPTLARLANELTRALRAFEARDQPAHLVLRPCEYTGMGVFVKDQCTMARDLPVAIFWGHLTDSPPDHSKYLLGLPDLHLGPGTDALWVDARLACLRGDPPPYQMAMLNHQCEDPPCVGIWHYPPGSAIPIGVAFTRRTLRGGTELTYNYDRHLRYSGYTVGRAEAAALGLLSSPCRCAGPAPCPRDRFCPL